MADWKPIKIENGEFARFQAGDTIPVEHGGTGVTNLTALTSAMNLVIGENIQAWNLKLDSLSSLSGNGILVKNGNEFSVRAISGTAGEITVSNADGVVGDPTVGLADITNSNTGSFLKFTTDSKGRVTGTTAVTASDISGLVGDGLYLKLTGGTLTGPLTLNGPPSLSNHAATKEYVDERAVGNNQKIAVKAGTIANITLTDLQTIDGVSLIAGDRVLVKDQTDQTQNGIYVVASGAWARPADADTGVELIGATVLISGGNTNSGIGYSVISPSPITIGTTNIIWTQSSGGAQIVAGNGLLKSGNTLSVQTINSSRITSGASGIDLAVSGVSAGTYSKVTVDIFGRVTVGATLTPADISAQPSNALLTALTTAGNGILVKTSATAAVARSVSGTAGQIAVANGDGVSGNPTVSLVSTGVGAGTYNNVTVDIFGRVTSGAMTQTAGLVEQLKNDAASSITIGQAVYTSGDGSVNLANANTVTTKDVVGLVFDTAINTGATGSIAVNGVVTATVAQWNTVTGQTGGLTVGKIYYLSATNGGLTSTAPTVNGYVAPVGIAISTTKMSINIGQTIKL